LFLKSTYRKIGAFFLLKTEPRDAWETRIKSQETRQKKKKDNRAKNKEQRDQEQLLF